MILVDTSAWIEFLRNSGSPVCSLVDELLASEIAICNAVRRERWPGRGTNRIWQSLRRRRARAVVIPTLATDFEDAAALYRRCRQQGETVGKLIDCLIASVAIRSGAPVLHKDADFDVLARHSGLQIHENTPGWALQKNRIEGGLHPQG